MRIAYFAQISGGDRSGVFHKVVAQVGSWQERGRSVRAFILTRDDPQLWRSAFDSSAVYRFDGPSSRLTSMARLARSLRAFDPDVLYLRSFPFYPTMLFFPRRSALVIEVNTDDTTEYALGSRLRSIYNDLTRGLILGQADAMVFVTSELSSSPSFSRFKARHEVITNGVDLSAYPELPKPLDGRPRLVFVGAAGQLWQGFDKVARLASLRPEWAFDVVGAYDPGDSPDNVTWHGPMQRTGVLSVLARAHVGIGTLALHRKALHEASPLKVREYLAVGLPVLYAYSDPDLEDMPLYSQRIGNTEGNIIEDLDKIDGFVNGSLDLRVPRSSVQHIDVSAKEGQRLALFDDIVEGDG